MVSGQRWMCGLVPAVGCALAVAVSRPAAAQGVSDAVLETPTLRLELIGLRRWTLGMIQDSLARYAPSDSLASHACAAILREKLGFAEAAVQYYPPGFGGNDKGYFAVTVVEPQDSAWVRYRPAFRDSLPDRSEWAAATSVFWDQNRAFQSAIQTPDFLFGRMGLDSLEAGLVPARPLGEFLRGHRADADRRMAAWTLAHDGNVRNRVVAVALLASLVIQDSAGDSTWWALVEALRDPDQWVGATAGQALRTVVEAGARPVDWTPVADGLRALLEGTNPWVHATVLETLTATRVSSSLAAPLLRGGGNLVLARLRSGESWGSRAAWRFLAQISGRDYGTDADAWERWLRAL